MSSYADGGPLTDGLDPRVWRVAAVVFVGPFMTQLDSTVVNLALSTIRRDLHSSIAMAQWIVGGYLLALALTLPLNGWLVDRMGAKRVYVGCFSAFTLASLFCGAARTMDALIWTRVLQGMAGGLLAPMTQMMIARFAGRYMARVMGYTIVPVLIAPILGPVLAGAILQYATWRWLFYLNVPVGIVAVGLAMFLLPHDDVPTHARPFDLVGFLVISLGLACLLVGLPQAARRDGAVTLLGGLAAARRVCVAQHAAGRRGVDRSPPLSEPRVFDGGRAPVSRQRHILRETVSGAAVLDHGLRAVGAAGGVDHGLHGVRHDVLISDDGILD